jgi:hypothetical protein
MEVDFAWRGPWPLLADEARDFQVQRRAQC